MFAIILFLGVVAILAFVGFIILLVLGLVFGILGFAGKATFHIAKFGFKLASLAGIIITCLVLFFIIF